MIDKNIWGTVCECGNEVFDYYDEHPWCEDKTIVKTVKCSNCGKINNIMIDKAEEYYNRKIFDCFSNLYGNILEIGCGGGLITEYVRGLEKSKIFSYFGHR